MHNYLVSGGVIWAFVSLVWLLSLIKKDSSIIDPCWSLFFLAAALTTALRGSFPPEGSHFLLLAMVTLWSLRLSIHLFLRNSHEGEDYRYQQWRKKHGSAWWWRSYLTVFMLQGILAWIICIPLTATLSLPSKSIGVLEIIGLVVWLQGFYFETAGDMQLKKFRADPATKGKVLNTGVWRYSRHPNYYGDAAQWWGFYLVAVGSGAWWTLYGPLLMTLLLNKVSGVVLLEKALVKNKPGYQDYITNTSSFVPWFPKA